LSIYEGIPHLLLPVVTDPKKANLALRWAVDEMERRYELLAKTGVRDISSYNARIEGADKKKDEAVLRPRRRASRTRRSASSSQVPTAPSRRSTSTPTPRSRW